MEDRMPSVDVVGKLDMQALENGANNLKREITTRFDFKRVTTEIVLDRKGKCLHITTADEVKVQSITEMFLDQCVRFKVDLKSLDIKQIEPGARGSAKRDICFKEGIPKETCQKIVKLIKGLKMKVQPAIQENSVRLTGKKIDDLQKIMQLLREQDYDVPLQFVNMKS